MASSFFLKRISSRVFNRWFNSRIGWKQKFFKSMRWPMLFWANSLKIKVFNALLTHARDKKQKRTEITEMEQWRIHNLSKIAITKWISLADHLQTERINKS